MPDSQSCTLHIFTGATGLVGSATILELLRTDPRAEVLALLRPGPDGAGPRLVETLQRAARLYGLGDSLDEAIATRCEALASDVHEPRCGVDPPARWHGAEMWHCAAALQFHDRFRDAVMQTNVEGTRHAIELARQLEVSTFNFVSTAYVVGERSGLIAEAPIESTDDLAPNNHYERSKAMAEQLVSDSGLRVRIMRPSIVVGHSQTRGAITFNSFYGFVRGVFKFRRLMERTQAQLMDSLEVRMLADPEGMLDVIPVDYVAQDALALSRADAEPGVYHLAGIGRHSTQRMIAVVFETVGLPRPIFVDDISELTWIDRKLHQAVSVYNAYLFGDKRFDRTQVDGVIGQSAGLGYVLDDEEVRRLGQWYLDHDLAPRKSRTTT
ncbi:MAG: SDR family oxidoreductase [Myxococcota bacterium]